MDEQIVSFLRPNVGLCALKFLFFYFFIALNLREGHNSRATKILLDSLRVFLKILIRILIQRPVYLLENYE